MNPPRPFGSPPDGWVPCFEALDRAEAAALADALRDAGIAAEPAQVDGLHVLAVPPADLPGAAGWLRAQGLADRPARHADRVRRLEGPALRGILGFVVAVVAVPWLALTYGGPISLLAWLLPLGVFWLAREWRRDSGSGRKRGEAPDP